MNHAACVSAFNCLRDSRLIYHPNMSLVPSETEEGTLTYLETRVWLSEHGLLCRYKDINWSITSSSSFLSSSYFASSSLTSSFPSVTLLKHRVQQFYSYSLPQHRLAAVIGVLHRIHHNCSLPLHVLIHSLLFFCELLLLNYPYQLFLDACYSIRASGKASSSEPVWRALIHIIPFLFNVPSTSIPAGHACAHTLFGFYNEAPL